MGGWIVGARPVSVFAQGVAHNPDIKGELTVIVVFYYGAIMQCFVDLMNKKT